MLFISKKLTVALVSIACIGGFVFATGTNIANNDTNKPIEVQAALEKTSASAIRITVDKGGWGWSNLHIHYWNVTTDEGYEHAGTAWRGKPLVNNSYEFPWYVSAVYFHINADEEGSANRETHDRYVDARGDYLVNNFVWDGETGKANVTVTRTGDYFQEDVFYVTNPGYDGGVDSSRTRLWLYRGHYGTADAIVFLNINDTLYEASDYVHAWEAGNNHHHYLAYYDVSINLITGKSFNFLKIKNDLTTIWNTSSTLTYATGDSSYLFKLDASSGDTLTKSTVTQSIRSNFFAKVLEGYLTCSDNLDNGYPAFGSIDNNFLPRDGEFWDMEGNLDDIDITDYAGKGTSGYTSSRGTGVQVNAYTKYEALNDLYTNSGTWTRGILINISINNEYLQPFFIGILFFGSLTLFTLISKKRRYQ
jgi:hypothetical protein